MRGGPGEWLSGHTQVLGLAEAATCLVLPFSSQICLLPPKGTDSGGSLAASAAKWSLVSWGLSTRRVWWVLVQMPQQLPVSDGEPRSETRVHVQVGHDGCPPNEGTFTVSPRYLQIWYLQIRLLAKMYLLSPNCNAPGVTCRRGRVMKN